MTGQRVDIEALPFDQYQRYRLVADVLREVADGKKLRILDVGGRTELLRSFLPEDRVDLVDVEESEAEGLVLGTGAALPFQDGSFDAVCAFDTLEHVPAPYREAFANECARVAKSWVILAGPYAHPRVDEAEERLVDFLKHKLQTRHRYLEEHRTHGLPDREATEAIFTGSGAEVASIGHGDVSLWLALMCAELYFDHDPMLRPVAPRFFRFYNKALFDHDHSSEVYRHAVVAAFDGAKLPSANPWGAEVRLPAQATDALQDLATELMAFDRDRDALAPELERLKGIIGDLEEDLEGHKSRLNDRTTDLEEHQETLLALRTRYDGLVEESTDERKVLEADLAEHKKSLEDSATELEKAKADFETAREEFEGLLEEHQGVIDGLEAEVSSRGKLNDQLQGELESCQADASRQAEDLNSQIEAHRTVEQELRDDLSQHKGALADTQGDLARIVQEAEAQRDTLMSEIAAQDQAREDLASDLAEHKRTIMAIETARDADLVAHREALEVVHEQLVRANEATELMAHAASQVQKELASQIQDYVAEQLRLEQHLNATDQAARSIQAELVDARGDVEHLQGVIAERDQHIAQLGGVIAELRGQLRNRVGNLKRAFGKKPEFRDGSSEGPEDGNQDPAGGDADQG